MSERKLSDVLYTLTLGDLIVDILKGNRMSSTPYTGGFVILQHPNGEVTLKGKEYLNLLAELRVKGKI